MAQPDIFSASLEIIGANPFVVTGVDRNVARALRYLHGQERFIGRQPLAK